MGVAELAAYLLAAVLVFVLCRIFIKPLKSVLLFVLNSLLGGVGLYILNWLLAPTGFFIGLNVATAAICGALGLPGVVLLVFIKLLFGV